MVETGTNIGGTYSETVTGNENYTVMESDNGFTDTSERTITGSGTYTRTDTGPGATLLSNSGSYGYTLTASTDAPSGVLSQTETGSDRYGLLETFNNVANTSSGSTPGNMNFSPFGQPFVDPNGQPNFWQQQWQRVSNTVSNAARETRMVASYVWNNPGEATSVATTAVANSEAARVASYVVNNRGDASRTFFGSIVGDIYRGYTALVTWQAGSAIGDRAVATFEASTGQRFSGTVSQWTSVLSNIGLQILGVQSIAEGYVGFDPVTQQQLSGGERFMRDVSGIGTFAGWAAAGVNGITRLFRPPNCFPAHTLVSTETGLRPIRQIEPGDRVWAYEMGKARWKLCHVLRRLGKNIMAISRR